ncbi:MAG: hypothetical protein OEV48_10720 [Acidobacteriota bacterium]|jgi:hypothetical protein|nr:hypothetical protein [Acidobacteriota bacterium]
MRRIEPAYPDLFPVTHVLRPGYMPGQKVSLDPIRLGVVWEDAPVRILPAEGSVPREPVRAIVFARVAAERQEIFHRLLERGSYALVVLDDPELTPSDLGLDAFDENPRVTILLPILPFPLSDGLQFPEAWSRSVWGAVLGLFPFPGSGPEVERRIAQLKEAGARFAVTAPLLLTRKDRHRILDGCEGTDVEDELENALFHADISRGLHALERRAGVTMHEVGMDPFVPCMVPHGQEPNAVRTSAVLRLWARRLDQCHEESSWGWRLRRAATALEKLPNDPATLAMEDNLRIVPGFDPWVESFTRAVWYGGDPLDSAWQRWSGINGQPEGDGKKKKSKAKK